LPSKILAAWFAGFGVTAPPTIRTAVKIRPPIPSGTA
jgi:hypothetical protein